jgi:hypothetical protein
MGEQTQRTDSQAISFLYLIFSISWAKKAKKETNWVTPSDTAKPHKIAQEIAYLCTLFLCLCDGRKAKPIEGSSNSMIPPDLAMRPRPVAHVGISHPRKCSVPRRCDVPQGKVFDLGGDFLINQL